MDGKINNFAQVASLRTYTLTGGTEDGLRVIDVDTGVLRFLLNASKALDIMQLYHKGTSISFLSKNGFTAREIEFDRRFEGGLLYTCGLDSIGGRAGFIQHGTLHNIPARVTTCRCDEEGILIEADIQDSALFGKNLVLHRTVRTAAGSDTFTLEDRLVNRSARVEDYCLMYHVNLGYPFLDEGVTLFGDPETVMPRNELARARMDERTVFRAPVDNAEERCYFLKNRTPRVEAVNRKLGKSFVMTYSGDTLPYMTQWISDASGDYAMGLEPSTTLLDDGFVYRQLAPGESRSFRVDFSVRSL